MDRSVPKPKANRLILFRPALKPRIATDMPRAVAHPARQPRSVATQERILAATEALLEQGCSESLTIEQIADRAHVSVGAIYKRFSGKSSLLPLILDRLHARQLAMLHAFLAEPRWRGATLDERVRALLQAFAESQVSRQRLIRALLVDHWQSTEPGPQEARAAEVMAAIHAWLSECTASIRHPDPPLALSLGLFTTLQTIQTAVMLDRVPPALGLDRFVSEQATMLLAYLRPATT